MRVFVSKGDGGRGLTLRLVSEAMKGGSSVRWFSVSERCVTFVRSET